MLTSINWDDFHAYISQYSYGIKEDMIRYIQGELNSEENIESAMDKSARLYGTYNHCGAPNTSCYCNDDSGYNEEMEEYYKTHCSCGAHKSDCIHAEPTAEDYWDIDADYWDGDASDSE